MNFDEQPDHYTIPEDYRESEKETIKWEKQHDPGCQPGPDGEKPKKCNRRRRIFTGTVIIFALVLGTAFWLRYMNPYVTDARERGYVVKVEKRGHLFNKWEGDMILQSSFTDSTNVYSRDFSFSVENPELALRLQEYQGTGRQVVVSYKRYSGTLPWRGSSANVITSVEPVVHDAGPVCESTETSNSMTETTEPVDSVVSGQI